MKGFKRLNWPKLREDFLAGEMTIADLARAHGCSSNYVNQIAGKEKWYAQRDLLHADARAAVTAEIASVLTSGADRSRAMDPLGIEEHLRRSVKTGDQLYILFESAVTAMKQGSLRDMRVAIDSWVILDNQMRKIHGVEGAGSRPLININVMASLPKPSESGASGLVEMVEMVSEVVVEALEVVAAEAEAKVATAPKIDVKKRLEALQFEEEPEMA